MAKKTKKKAAAKKAPAKKTAKKAPVKAAASNKPPTKSEVYRAIADKTGLARKDVVGVCDALNDIMTGSVKKYGSFNYMGLLKLTLVKKPAVKGGKLVKNPFTGEMVKQKARPASRSVRVRPMKAIKDAL
ncbi:MAG: HU family DNA-binding protein [Krumholzibacteria bacterium]|nr:HU family DNA-binding protein [Candidatus Krumholzibacteria bacterium]